MPDGGTVDVQSFLNRQPFSRFQGQVFAMCFCIVLLDGFDTAAIGYIAPALVKEWGLERAALAPVLSAALFGLAVGALAAGPLADRLGRRTIAVASVLLFGVACLGSAFSGSLSQLVAARFVTGLGLGAAMPNAATLMSEYCPDRRRATITNAMFCGFPLGAAFGGFLAAWMIPHYGWRSVLVLGGALPLALSPALLSAMPESVRHLVSNGYPAARIRAALGRVAPVPQTATAFSLGEERPAPSDQGGLGLVLSRPYAAGSVLLWLAYFMGLLIFYALINWMPILLKEAGLSQGTAALVTALFPLGGFGAVASGWLMDRFNAVRVVACCYALTAVAVFAIGQAAGDLGILTTVILLGGTLMNTAQTSMPALAASFYPTSGRATGVSWMLGIGRFGGIAGSVLVGELSRRNLDIPTIFATVAVPGLVAAAALSALSMSRRSLSPAGRPTLADTGAH